MKTFKQFILEATATEKLLNKTIEKLKASKNDPEKIKLYATLLKRTKERLNPQGPYDYPEREAARKDKYLIPSSRTSSFPELVGTSTITKNPKKLRKQRALKEL